MKALLKCYYGYQNRGDELLFFGVVSYLFDHYEDLTHLDVEVGDVSWMYEWCELNHDLRQPYRSRVRFVTSRKLSIWFADYDMIYLGGGEVLASKTRSFWHGGVNYLALFWRWIWTGRVVWLGGIETPSVWWSQLLYRMMLPYAQQIVCREQGSYDIAKQYTDKVVLYHDWAIDILNQTDQIRPDRSDKLDILCRDTTSACPNGNDTMLASEKKQKVILLHGIRRSTSTTPNKWMLRCVEQLTQKGYEVHVPFLERSREAGRTNWKEILDQYADIIDYDTILVGHSAGGAAIVRWLGEHQINIEKLILVAPGYISRPHEPNRISTQTGEIIKREDEAGIRDLYDFTIQLSIKDLVQDGITVFTSNDSDRILQSAEKYILILDAKHLILDDRGHFNGSYGPQNETFVELIEEIIANNEQRTARVAVPINERDGLPRHSCLVSRNDDNNEQRYILINFIPKHTSPEIITQFHQWMQDYPDHQIINFPAERGDVLPEEIVMQYADRIQTRQRWEHDMGQSLAIFQQADAGFGQRLHFIIACVYYRIPIFRTSYSEKVDKILQFFATEL